MKLQVKCSWSVETYSDFCDFLSERPHNADNCFELGLTDQEAIEQVLSQMDGIFDVYYVNLRDGYFLIREYHMPSSNVTKHPVYTFKNLLGGTK